jgi:hypothetical protein
MQVQELGKINKKNVCVAKSPCEPPFFLASLLWKFLTKNIFVGCGIIFYGCGYCFKTPHEIEC